MNKIINEAIKTSEENIKFFPSDNRFVQAIKRSLDKTRKLLTDFEKKKIDVATFTHDVRNSLASAFGYAELLQLKGKNPPAGGEKIYAENILKALKNILEEVNKLKSKT